MAAIRFSASLWHQHHLRNETKKKVNQNNCLWYRKLLEKPREASESWYSRSQALPTCQATDLTAAGPCWALCSTGTSPSASGLGWRRNSFHPEHKSRNYPSLRLLHAATSSYFRSPGISGVLPAGILEGRASPPSLQPNCKARPSIA